MSLEYRKDEAEEPNEEFDQEENYQPPPEVIPFPVYTTILVGCVLIVTAIQFGTGIEEGALAAGFVKPAVREYGEYWRILTGGNRPRRFAAHRTQFVRVLQFRQALRISFRSGSCTDNFSFVRHRRRRC